MKIHHLLNKARRSERGVAAVEFALLLPILIVLLAAPLYIGRVLWHYTAAQKAAHDAALYLATVSDIEMRSPGLAPAAAALANNLVSAELADLNAGGFPPVVTIQCDGVTCAGYTVPTIVRVYVQMRIQEPFFCASFGGDDGVFISADAQMSYIGSQ